VILEGKRILVTGVLNRRSIAFSIAERAQAEGAEVLLTGFGRSKRMTERAAGRLAGPPEVLELDVNDDGSLAALREELRGRWPRVDGAVHAIAFAPADALGGDFLATPRASAGTAFETSAYSFKALADCLEPLMAGGGSLVGLDFDAAVAWPAYDWMGVAKAALESVSRYLARDLGQRGIRVNLLAAGPMRTAAASGIDGFEELASAWPQRAPLGWDAEDPSTVADAALFLLSDLSRATSGEIIHVDGGAHALGQGLVY
jgi:enoyl-[acyl-carrier protein] reductase I